MGRGEEVWSHNFRSFVQGIAGICIDPKSAVILQKFPGPSLITNKQTKANL